jgi:hypothetical protein
MCVTFPVHLSLLDSIIPITVCEHKLRSSSLFGLYYFLFLESTYSSGTISVYGLQSDAVRVSAIQKIYKVIPLCLHMYQTNTFWITCVFLLFM